MDYTGFLKCIVLYTYGLRPKIHIAHIPANNNKMVFLAIFFNGCLSIISNNKYSTHKNIENIIPVDLKLINKVINNINEYKYIFLFVFANIISRINPQMIKEEISPSK